MQVPTTKIDIKNTSSYFENFCTSVQKKANACVKTINQNEVARETLKAVNDYAPVLIAFIGSMFAPVGVTIGCCAAVLALSQIKPQLVSEQTAGKVAIGVGASMGITKIVIPFAKLLTYAAVSGGLIFFGVVAATSTPEPQTRYNIHK